MFDILKKKISGFVNKLSGKLSEKEEKKAEEKKPEEPSELKKEPMPELRLETKPEPMPELKPEPRPEIKPEPEPEAKPEITKPRPEVEARALVKPKLAEPDTEPEEKPVQGAAVVKPEEKLPEVKTSFFGKVKSLILPEHKISENDISEPLEELETQLITADVALPVAETIVSDMKERMVGKKIKFSEMNQFVRNTMLNSVTDVMRQDKFNLLNFVKSKEKPVKILFVGPNGAGKTTTIAKIAYLLKKNGISSVMSASDTFRAAAIEQTEEHARRVGVPVIKHQYGSDPAAVAFDSVKYAESHKIDVVLIDTAGRQETNKNLIEQLRKIVRISKPDLKIFIGEGIVGNAIISQVSEFNEAIALDGVILSKVDVDSKGGTIISVRKATGIPILYIAVGQSYEDLLEFDPNFVISKLFT